MMVYIAWMCAGTRVLPKPASPHGVLEIETFHPRYEDKKTKKEHL